jgi:hypothetical protein
VLARPMRRATARVRGLFEALGENPSPVIRGLAAKPACHDAPA